MVTFPMPAMCLECDKRCDGHYFCSDKCREKAKARAKAEYELNHPADKKNKEALDSFFAKNI